MVGIFPEYKKMCSIQDSAPVCVFGLRSEKRSMLNIWKKREKQIGVVVGNAVEMRGEIEGLVSGYKVLPSVDELELGSIGD